MDWASHTYARTKANKTRGSISAWAYGKAPSEQGPGMGCVAGGVWRQSSLMAAGVTAPCGDFARCSALTYAGRVGELTGLSFGGRAGTRRRTRIACEVSAWILQAAPLSHAVLDAVP